MMGQRYREKDISAVWCDMACNCIIRQKNIPLYIGRSGYSCTKTWFRKGGKQITPLPKYKWNDNE